MCQLDAARTSAALARIIDLPTVGAYRVRLSPASRAGFLSMPLQPALWRYQEEREYATQTQVRAVCYRLFASAPEDRQIEERADPAQYDPTKKRIEYTWKASHGSDDHGKLGVSGAQRPSTDDLQSTEDHETGERAKRSTARTYARPRGRSGERQNQARRR